jgi:hypothetical protein
MNCDLCDKPLDGRPLWREFRHADCQQVLVDSISRRDAALKMARKIHLTYGELTYLEAWMEVNLPDTTLRDREIYLSHKAGGSYTEIARIAAITRSRVEQICSRVQMYVNSRQLRGQFRIGYMGNIEGNGKVFWRERK